MARIKVDEITNLAENGNVSFPSGGASFQGNVSVGGSLTADSVNASIALKILLLLNYPHLVIQ